MSFTYFLQTDIGKMRLELGDTTPGVGITPTGANLTDEELQIWLDREGDLMRGVAAACEALSRAWTASATITVGPRTEAYGALAEQWANRARALRASYGETPGSGVSGAFSVGLRRVDEEDIDEYERQ